MNDDDDVGAEEAVAPALVDKAAAAATELVTVVKSADEHASPHDHTTYVPAEDAAVASNGPSVEDGAAPSLPAPVGTRRHAIRSGSQVEHPRTQ